MRDGSEDAAARSDPLRRFTRTELAADLSVMARKVRFETNHGTALRETLRMLAGTKIQPSLLRFDGELLCKMGPMRSLLGIKCGGTPFRASGTSASIGTATLPWTLIGERRAVTCLSNW